MTGWSGGWLSELNSDYGTFGLGVPEVSKYKTAFWPYLEGGEFSSSDPALARLNPAITGLVSFFRLGAYCVEVR